MNCALKLSGGFWGDAGVGDVEGAAAPRNKNNTKQVPAFLDQARD